MTLVPLQALTFAPALVVLLVLAVAIITVYSSVEIVNAYEKRALTVLGDYRKQIGRASCRERV